MKPAPIRSVSLALFASACALAGCTRPPAASTSRSPVLEPRSAVVPSASGAGPRLERRGPPHAPELDARTAAEHEAGAVIRALHPKLLSCYSKRLATHPRAHAFVVVDVLVGEDGRPRQVSTTGGALLGREAVDCIAGRVRGASFAPPAGGGTSRVRVPFAFHPNAVGDDG